jgi:hypothetical protein
MTSNSILVQASGVIQWLLDVMVGSDGMAYRRGHLEREPSRMTRPDRGKYPYTHRVYIRLRRTQVDSSPVTSRQDHRRIGDNGDPQVSQIAQIWFSSSDDVASGSGANLQVTRTVMVARNHCGGYPYPVRWQSCQTQEGKPGAQQRSAAIVVSLIAFQCVCNNQRARMGSHGSCETLLPRELCQSVDRLQAL